MRTPLRIVPTQRTRREAVAWFVFGRSSAEWLAAVADWNVPLSAVVFRIVPRSAADRTPIGALVTIDVPAAGIGKSPVAGPVGAQYARIAQRLFLPVDAEIWPQVTESELSDLLVDDSDYIFHPALGLVRCETTDRLRAINLVQSTSPARISWSMAVPGTAFTSRVLSIEPAVTPTADEILRQAGQEIGSQGGSLDDVPLMPGEGLGGQIHQWTRPLRNLWKSLLRPKNPKPVPEDLPRQNPPPHTGKTAPPGAGWFGWLGMAVAPLASAGAVLGKVLPKSVIDQAARLREVDRLLHMLKHDPEAGLRFALPMGGEASGRGVASPTNQLLARNIDFGLGQLFRGGPVDAWAIPPNQQFQLIQMYRELAAREIRMGRHRRAAYIFAELLGDFAGAANSLEAGLHYREAAALYRDRLKRPQDAARCLERGGLLNEAAELYLELGMIENAADLYLRLDQSEEAGHLLRNWVGQLTAQGHHLKASTILETKLGDVDGALSVLDAGWNLQTEDSETCLTNWFMLLSQHGRHEDATQRIAELRGPGLAESRVSVLARALASVASRHVSQSVRYAAEDAARVVVARQLPLAPLPDARGLLSIIRQLAPQDRLLTRDCNRFVKQKEEAVRRQAIAPKTRKAGITLVRSFELEGTDIQWKTAKSNGEAMYAVGHTQGGLLLRRVSWLTTWIQNHQSIYWANVSPDRRILLEVSRGRSDQVLLHALGHPPLGARTFIGGATVSGICHAGSPSWATASTVAFACSDGGTFNWRVRAVFGALELAGFGPSADEVTNGLLRVNVEEELLTRIPVSICAAAKPIRIGVGPMICRPLFSTDEKLQGASDDVAGTRHLVDLDSVIQSLHNYRDAETDCIVALFDDGGVMIPEPIQDNHPQPIAKDMESPTGAFLGNGTFVVAADRECRAYRFAGGTIQVLGTVALEHPAIAVTQTDLLSQFAVLESNGNVEVFVIDQ